MKIPGSTGAKFSVFLAAMWSVGYYLSARHGCVISLKVEIGEFLMMGSLPLVLLGLAVPKGLSPEARLGVLCIYSAANFLFLGYGLPWFWNQVRENSTTRSKPTKAEQAVPSDGHKPSSSSTTTDPTAPADAH